MTQIYTRFQDIPQFPHANYQVDIEWGDMQFQLDRYIKNYQLDLNPDFQREHVWDDAKRIAYVEFILRGGASSRDIYLNCPGWQTSMAQRGPMQLVDGKQRLDAAFKFMNNEIPAFGSYLKDFTDRLTYRAGFKFHINSLNTRAEVLSWYIDLNSGGVIHTNEEIERVKRLLELENK